MGRFSWVRSCLLDRSSRQRFQGFRKRLLRGDVGVLSPTPVKAVLFDFWIQRVSQPLFFKVVCRKVLGLLNTGRRQVGSDACSPDRMILETGRCQVGSDACSPDRTRRYITKSHMLLETGRDPGASDACCIDGMLLVYITKSHMILETGRCLVGSDACSPHRMRLETERYQVGKDSCSPYRMLLGTEST